MKIMLKRNLTTTLTEKRTGIIHEIRTRRLEHEPNAIFEGRHRLKVEAKKWYLRRMVHLY